MKSIESILKKNPINTRQVLGFFIKRNQPVQIPATKKIAGIKKVVTPGKTNYEVMAISAAEKLQVTIRSSQLLGFLIILFIDSPRRNRLVSVYRIDEWEGDIPKHGLLVKKQEHLYALHKIVASQALFGIFVYRDKKLRKIIKL